MLFAISHQQQHIIFTSPPSPPLVQCDRETSTKMMGSSSKFARPSTRRCSILLSPSLSLVTRLPVLLVVAAVVITTTSREDFDYHNNNKKKHCCSCANAFLFRNNDSASSRNRDRSAAGARRNSYNNTRWKMIPNLDAVIGNDNPRRRRSNNRINNYNNNNGGFFLKRRNDNHHNQYRLLDGAKLRQQQQNHRSMEDREDLGGDNNNNNKNKIGSSMSRKEKIRRRGMSVALASSYFAVMGAKCALPSVLIQLTSKTHGLTFVTTTTSSLSFLSPQEQMAQLLGLSTLSIAIGKLILGPMIDTMGGIRSLQLALSALCCSLLTIATAQSFYVFGTCWICIDFIFSACWPACINAIYQSFPKNDENDDEVENTEWSKQIGMLATGARIGNASAFAFFAMILHILDNANLRGAVMRQSWRYVFLSSAILQIFPLGLVSYFGGMTSKMMKERRSRDDGFKQNDDSEIEVAAILPPTPPTTSTISTKGTTPSPSSFWFLSPIQRSLSILRKEVQTTTFWFHLISRSCLMVFASFLLFVPTLMSGIHGCSNALSSQVGSIYALGCLLSVTFGSQIYSSLSTKRSRVTMIGTLLTLATISSGMQLAHVSGWVSLPTSVAIFSMFLWGFAFSIPFYLPPSLYALSRGGRDGSASIADCFDFFGFALLAIFNRYVGSIPHTSIEAWVPCFQLTTGAAVISLITQSVAVFAQ